jgi:site-specific DNA-adenine methylase
MRFCGYRTNKQGHFNVPFSDSRVGQYPERTEFLNSCNQIARAKFVRGDFFEVVKSKVRKGDFVYLARIYPTGRWPYSRLHEGASRSAVQRLQDRYRRPDAGTSL